MKWLTNGFKFIVGLLLAVLAFMFIVGLVMAVGEQIVKLIKLF